MMTDIYVFVLSCTYTGIVQMFRNSLIVTFGAKVSFRSQISISPSVRYATCHVTIGSTQNSSPGPNISEKY